ncbi:MAG TPA: electron transport complex subunit RsxC [Rhodocyclaceae bacterium]
MSARLPFASLFSFRGGVKPPAHKEDSCDTPIARAALPERLVVPLHQSIGGTPKPLVKTGDKVLKGQMIGAADGMISAAVHAPTSGRVEAVELAPQPHPSGLSAMAVTIVPDGEERWGERLAVDLKTLTPVDARQRLQDAGVVGLGGAAFPSHAKLDATPGRPLEELVINGAECEPFITCDDRLMRERAEDILRGTALLRDLMQPKRVLIGVEDNKPEAIAALQEAARQIGESGFEIRAVPTLYPAGGAKQLIRVLTGKAIAGTVKRTTDFGVQCFNVATAYTVWRALAHGEPVLSRVVTLAGSVGQPGNWELPIGMSVADAIALAKPKADSDGVLMGGPMMGFRLPDTSAPVVKATNCLIAASPELLPPPPPEMPCIRCGECARACPHELQPFEMYWWSRAKNFGKAQEYALFDCIECGCCSYVCPSNIPLVQYFRFAKGEIWSRERERLAAEGARSRFEFRQFREERDKQEKAERLARAAAAQKAKAAAQAADPEAAAKQAEIAAALERTRSQREAAAAAAAAPEPATAPKEETPPS